MIRVVIPYGGDDPDRAASLAFVLDQLPGQLDAEIHVGRCDGVWSKAAAVADALDPDWPDDDILIVHDADIWIPKLAETPKFLQRFPWVVPHKFVHRMKPELSTQVLDGIVPFTGLGKVGWEQNPYPGVVGGGCTILTVGSYRLCPLDPRFEGWGQEDESWGFALNQMLGRPWRGPHNLYHFWHAHPQRISRSVGSNEGELLRNRYRGARGNRLMMSRLLDEFREAPAELG